MSAFRDLWRYLHALLINSYDVFFQKLSMRHLGDLDSMSGPMDGLTVIVTGPTSGIGKETAAVLARKGATVVLACRNSSRGNALKAELEAAAKAAGSATPLLEVRILDLASMASVRSFASSWEAEGRALHVLVNNAGILGMGVSREETEDGFESHMGSNYLGHFLLTTMLLPALQRGGGERAGAWTDQAYGQSKLAQIMFTRELNKRLADADIHNVTALALHPGMVLTNVVRSLPALVQTAYKAALSALLLSPSQGARASTYCACNPRAPHKSHHTGGYLSSNCIPVQPSPAAKDPVAARWLWQWSVQQTKLDPQFQL
ncbi:MAG: hypothetical protein WDW38_008090 [Sanguina aurantia]